MYNNNELKNILSQQIERYPELTLQDAVKLVYQLEFGGGHLSLSPDKSLAMIAAEYPAPPNGEPGAEPLYEEIGGGLVRLNLRSACAAGLAPATVNRLFMEAIALHTGTAEGFECRLSTLREILPGLGIAGSEQIDAYIAQYRQEGFPAVSHSKAYKAAYNPSYRVILREHARFIMLFARIDERLSCGLPVTVAIDGRCGSGKSTLASLLERIYSCNVFHMDDFFLPPEARTPQRLSIPGGNVEHERFRREVLVKLKTGQPVAYGRYSCSTGKMQMADAPPANLNIVEGVYSLHPSLQGLIDIKVMLTVGRDEQLKRVKARNPDTFARFIKEWIPLEEVYFNATAIDDSCDLLFNTSV